MRCPPSRRLADRLVLRVEGVADHTTPSTRDGLVGSPTTTSVALVCGLSFFTG